MPRQDDEDIISQGGDSSQLLLEAEKSPELLPVINRFEQQLDQVRDERDKGFWKLSKESTESIQALIGGGAIIMALWEARRIAKEKPDAFVGDVLQEGLLIAVPWAAKKLSGIFDKDAQDNQFVDFLTRAIREPGELGLPDVSAPPAWIRGLELLSTIIPGVSPVDIRIAWYAVSAFPRLANAVSDLGRGAAKGAVDQITNLVEVGKQSLSRIQPIIAPGGAK